jgi:hypothetical protein
MTIYKHAMMVEILNIGHTLQTGVLHKHTDTKLYLKEPVSKSSCRKQLVSNNSYTASINMMQTPPDSEHPLIMPCAHLLVVVVHQVDVVRGRNRVHLQVKQSQKGNNSNTTRYK